MSRIHQWTNDTRLGYINDELDRIYDHSIDKLWFPVTLLDSDDTATSPVAWKQVGGGRILTQVMSSTASNNEYVWTSFRPSTQWREEGAYLKYTYYFGLNAAGAGTDTVRFTSTGYAYDVGDAFTSPTVVMNVSTNLDVSAYSSETIYTEVFTSTNAMVDAEWISVRVGRASTDAADTYASDIYFLGLLVEMTYA